MRGLRQQQTSHCIIEGLWHTHLGMVAVAEHIGARAALSCLRAMEERCRVRESDMQLRRQQAIRDTTGCHGCCDADAGGDNAGRHVARRLSLPSTRCFLKSLGVELMSRARARPHDS